MSINKLRVMTSDTHGANHAGTFKPKNDMDPPGYNILDIVIQPNTTLHIHKNKTKVTRTALRQLFALITTNVRKDEP
jgi:hypothetical protein